MNFRVFERMKWKEVAGQAGADIYEYYTYKNEILKAKKYFEIGSNKLDEELFEEAEQQFISSLNYLPDRISTLSKLLLCKIQLRKYDDCEKLLSQIEAIDKDYVQQFWIGSQG